MELVDKVRAEAQQVAEVTSKESAQEVGLLSDAISVYAEAFMFSNDLAKPEAATVRKALLSHNFNTLNLAFDAALRGYYIQSIALLRKRLKTSKNGGSRANLQDDQIQATLPDRVE
jgi:hypothetical protein